MGTSKRLLTGALVLAGVLAWASASLAAVPDFIVESRSGGQNFGKYSDVGMANAGSKSTAPGCTPGIGSRYGSVKRSAVGEKHAYFNADLGVAGRYEVFVTWGNQSGRYNGPVAHVITHRDGVATVELNHNATMNQWISLGQYNFNAGTNVGRVDINNLSGPGTDSGNFMADAVKWVLIAADCDSSITQPTITAPLPLLHTDTSITVSGLDSNATVVTVYDCFGGTATAIATKTLPGNGATPSSVSVDVDLSALSGHPISIGQTIGDRESCVNLFGVKVDDCSLVSAVTVAGSYIPPANTDFSQVLLAGDTKVRVTGVSSQATSVAVFANGAEIGRNSSPGGATTVDVTVQPLPAGATISAVQALRGLDGCVPATGPKVGDCSRVPAVRVVGLVNEGMPTVRVTNVDPKAEVITVYVDSTVIGTVTSDNISSPHCTVVLDTAVRPNGLVLGEIVKATQTIRGVAGCMPGDGVAVKPPGIIEDFNSAVTIVQSGTGTAYRTWYDVAGNAYTEVLRSGSTGSLVTAPQLFGSPCLGIYDHGWTNGAYAKFEQVIPADDPVHGNQYHLVVDMLVDERGNGDQTDKDFIKSYEVGVVVNGAHRPSGGSLPGVSSPIGTYMGPLTPEQDGYVDNTTPPFQVLTETFTAEEGDDLLIVFSTNCATYESGKSAANGKYVGMLIDNIRLVRGPRPCLPQDAGTVDVITPAPPAAATPLEAGRTQVTVDRIATTASKVTVYEYDPALGADPSAWVKIGEATPGGVTRLVVNTAPMTAGKTIVATQTMTVCTPPQEMEGPKGVVGPVVGTGQNTAVRLTLGIREDAALSGPIGASGSTSSNVIEWVGASSVIGNAPQGKLITPSANWQTVTFYPVDPDGDGPLTADPIRSYANGNGALDGAFGILEHLAVSIAGPPYNTGRYVLYIDNVKNGDVTIADFDTEDPQGIAPAVGSAALFRAPSYSGSTAQFLLAWPNISTVTSEKADGPGNSLKLEFQFSSDQNNHWVRLTTARSDPGMPYQNPKIDLTQPISFRVLLFACHSPFADADDDGDVDQEDFGILQACLYNFGGPACSCFDTDGDNEIDADDLSAFVNCAIVSGPDVIPDQWPANCPQ